MKKQIISFVLGATIFGSIGVFAGQNVAYDNPYLVQINGQPVAISGYQINDYTYFKLRDIASIVGGFDVNFDNDTIQLTSPTARNQNIDYSKYIGKYSKVGGSLGFAWGLNIYEIKDGKVKFDFSYEKPTGVYFTNDATFINETVAVAEGKIVRGDEYDEKFRETPIIYTLIFKDDGIDVNTLMTDEKGLAVRGPRFTFSDKIE